MAAPFAPSLQQLGVAQAKLDAIGSAPDDADVRQLWSEFLTALQRSVTKIEQAVKGHTSAQARFNDLKHAQREDEVLAYLKAARDTDEHGLKAVTDRETSYGFNPKPGRSSIHVDYMGTDENGELQMGPAAQASLDLVSVESSTVLRPVTNRGRTYAVPRLYGAGENPTPFALGEYAISRIRAAIERCVAELTSK